MGLTVKSEEVTFICILFYYIDYTTIYTQIWYVQVGSKVTSSHQQIAQLAPIFIFFFKLVHLS